MVDLPLVALCFLISTGVLLFMGEIALAMFSFAAAAVFVKIMEKTS